jgi:mannose-6-phosphate isomerase-like protein (cupin superfamily)
METTSTVRLRRGQDVAVEEHPWGHLTWMVSGQLGNSEELTVGTCHISPGQHNPRHHHPNCDEVLHVLRGRIVHTLGDEEFDDAFLVRANNAFQAGTVFNPDVRRWLWEVAEWSSQRSDVLGRDARDVELQVDEEAVQFRVRGHLQSAEQLLQFRDHAMQLFEAIGH